MNKWELYYKKTLDNIHNNILAFAKMLVYYYKFIIINKENDIQFIKAKYNLKIDYNIFEKYILKTKNLAIFTIFNNIPDYLHPLDKIVYYNYGAYISFLDPVYFNIKDNNIIILNKNILICKNFHKPFIYQDTPIYGINKKYIYINIKFFTYIKFKTHLLILMNKNKDIFIVNNNEIKQKFNNKFVVINKDINDILIDLVYISVLRKINKDDILNVFNSLYVIKKDTDIYSFHKKNKQLLWWFTFNKDDFLKDPFQINKTKGEIINQYNCKIKKEIKCLNLTIDILSNNKLNKTEDISLFLNDVYNKKKNLDKYNNIIFNGNLNYIKNKNSIKTWNDNQGKRLLCEIFFKSSNFIINGRYYFQFLKNFGFDIIVNSYGYYDKFDKFFSYELGFNIDSSDYIKIINKEKFTINYN